ncbi:MAG: bacillithiol biosynthesis cysteine-adding enzyme BshC [Bacteroidota bacterium]
MDCKATRLPYRQTNSFSKTVLDYLDHKEELKPFYTNPPTLQGLQKAIGARKNFDTNRALLVQALKKQYEGVATSDKVKNNIASLLSGDTFTITTAHQNNIFTGPLYFIYKIIHAIKLADHVKTCSPAQNFVPVYYIGSEDADLDELNHIYLGGEKLIWETTQTGAVGRMKIDKGLLKLIGLMEGQLAVLPHGQEYISRIKEHYKEGVTVQDATFRFVNSLFAEYGLVVLLPDNATLKAQTTSLFEDDLLHQTASGIVEETASALSKAGYKVQANPREINLFYLKDDIRDRIEKTGKKFSIQHPPFDFEEKELLEELQRYPDRFSPNVILRGLFQETILPNIAFIGGGGETAYWLQLKTLFAHYKIPFPVLVLRNSFLIVERKWQSMIAKLGFATEDFFLPEQELVNRMVARETGKKLKLNGTFTETEQLYALIKKQATAVDTTLEKHVEALKTQTLHRLQELEKKMLKAEKRKFADQQRQIHTIKGNLFPGSGLQERRDNLGYYYAKWGKDFIRQLYDHSPGLEQEFVILQEAGAKEI